MSFLALRLGGFKQALYGEGCWNILCNNCTQSLKLNNSPTTEIKKKIKYAGGMQKMIN